MAVRSIVPNHERNLARLSRAKQLIHRKRYADARALLLTIDHPIAGQWIRHLDEFELGNPFKKKANKWRKAVVNVVLVLMLLSLLLLIKDSHDKSEEARQRVRDRYGAVVYDVEVCA